MKYLSLFLGFMILVVVSIYTISFTPVGNNILRPIVEKILQQYTNLESKLNVFSINTSEIEINLELNKNNFIKFKGVYSFFSQSFNIKYFVDLEELGTLKPLTSTVLNGSLQTNGTVSGDMKFINILGVSNIVDSNTKYKIELVEFHPKSIVTNIKDTNLNALLYMFNQKTYNSTKIDIDITLDANSIEDNINYICVIDSDIAKITSDGNIKADPLGIDMNYHISVEDLDTLYFITNRHLKGSMHANGKLIKKKNLDLTMHSEVGGGKLYAKLHNNDLHINVNTLNTLSILEMLMYPRVFDSYLNGVLDYDISKENGIFKGKLFEGKFTQNRVLDLTKQYAKINMYKESFQGDLNARINREEIVAALNLQSKNSYISTQDTYINSMTKNISSELDINANGNEFSILLNGDINSPDIRVNADELIKKEATKAIVKELGKFFNGLNLF